MAPTSIQTISQYITACDTEKQPMLNELYALIRRAVPQDTQQKISWGMPTFALYGNLIHFASAKHHIGLYPGADAVAAFANELQCYKTSKGAIQLPLDKPLPKDLILRIIAYNVAANTREEEERKLKKKK